MNEDHTKAIASASHIMLIELFALLITKGLLSHEEAKEMIDRCLLNFETHSALAEKEDEAATALARGIFEKILARLAPLRSDHQGQS